MFRKMIGAAIAMAAIATSTAAYAVDYKCTMQEKPGIPPVIIIIEDNGKTFAYDGLIKDIYDKPIPAAISVDNKRRMTYAWTVKGVMGKNTERGNTVSGRLNFRLTRQKANGAATIYVKVVGYDNTFRSKGSCEVLK